MATRQELRQSLIATGHYDQVGEILRIPRDDSEAIQRWYCDTRRGGVRGIVRLLVEAPDTPQEVAVWENIDPTADPVTPWEHKADAAVLLQIATDPTWLGAIRARHAIETLTSTYTILVDTAGTVGLEVWAAVQDGNGGVALVPLPSAAPQI